MSFWDGKFVLRTVEISEEENRSNCYLVYRHAESVDALTPDNNYFDTAPFPASMQLYAAEMLAPPRQWQVRLASVPPVWVSMGVFQLRTRI